MKGLLLATALLASSVAVATAQRIEEDFMRYKIETDENEQPHPILIPDTTVFYRPTMPYDNGAMQRAEYALWFVDCSRRGVAPSERQTVCGGVEIGYRAGRLLGALRVDRTSQAGILSGKTSAGGAGGMEEYSAGGDAPFDEQRITLEASGRGYLGGIRYFAAYGLRREWTLTVYAALRGGRDIYADGVFANTADMALRAVKRFDNDATLSLALLLPLSKRGLRQAAAEEVFRLTGDNLYNPAWGMQSGKMRSARVRRSADPALLLSSEIPAGRRARLTATLLLSLPRYSLSMPAWFDAETPQPDHYRNLPSYFTDKAAAAVVRDVWSSGDMRYTQIDWHEMYARNALRGERGAAYVIERRTEISMRLAAAATVETTPREGLAIRYGIRTGYECSRRFKRMDDLLGATFLLDRDCYLVDDDTFGNMLQNDLRHPDRRIGKGDRFGYDYNLTQRHLGICVMAIWRRGRSELHAAAELSSLSVGRRGYFEKELFAGNGSYGRSKRIVFAPYTLKAAWHHALTPRHGITLAAVAAAAAPEADDIFLQTQYNNRTTDRPRTSILLGGEAAYRFHSPTVDIHLTGFATLSRRESRILHSYDDMSGAYSDIAIDDIERLGTGIEAAATVRYSRRWQSAFTFTAASYRYAADPAVTLYDDRDNSVISTSRSRMTGCRTGAPQLTAYADVAWYPAGGWSLRMSMQYAGSRHVEPSAVRRTERLVATAGSEERREEMMHQQRLPDAASVDASVAKTFAFGRSELRIMLSVRNLTNAGDIVYAGREQNRVRRYTAGDMTHYRPFDNLLTYAYPRTYYISVGWSF